MADTPHRPAAHITLGGDSSLASGRKVSPAVAAATALLQKGYAEAISLNGTAIAKSAAPQTAAAAEASPIRRTAAGAAVFSNIYPTHGPQSGGAASPPLTRLGAIDSALRQFSNDSRKVSGGRSASPAAPSAAGGRGATGSPYRRAGDGFMSPTSSHASREQLVRSTYYGPLGRDGSPAPTALAPRRAASPASRGPSPTRGSPRRQQEQQYAAARARSPGAKRAVGPSFMWNPSGNAKQQETPNTAIREVNAALLRATSASNMEREREAKAKAAEEGRRAELEAEGAKATSLLRRGSGGAQSLLGVGDKQPSTRSPVRRPSVDPGRPLFGTGGGAQGGARGQSTDRMAHTLNLLSSRTNSPRAVPLSAPLSASASAPLGGGGALRHQGLQFGASAGYDNNNTNPASSPLNALTGVIGGGTQRRAGGGGGGHPIDYLDRSGYARTAHASGDLFTHCGFASGSREGRIITLVKNFQQTSLFRWHQRVKEIASASNRCAYLSDADAKFLENVLSRNIAFMRNLEAIVAEAATSMGSPNVRGAGSSPARRPSTASVGPHRPSGSPMPQRSGSASRRPQSPAPRPTNNSNGAIDCGVIRFAHEAFEQSTQFNNAINLLLVGNTAQLRQLQKDRSEADASLFQRRVSLSGAAGAAEGGPFSASMNLPSNTSFSRRVGADAGGGAPSHLFPSATASPLLPPHGTSANGSFSYFSAANVSTAANANVSGGAANSSSFGTAAAAAAFFTNNGTYTVFPPPGVAAATSAPQAAAASSSSAALLAASGAAAAQQQHQPQRLVFSSQTLAEGTRLANRRRPAAVGVGGGSSAEGLLLSFDNDGQIGEAEGDEAAGGHPFEAFGGGSDGAPTAAGGAPSSLGGGAFANFVGPSLIGEAVASLANESAGQRGASPSPPSPSRVLPPRRGSSAAASAAAEGSPSPPSVSPTAWRGHPQGRAFKGGHWEWGSF